VSEGANEGSLCDRCAEMGLEFSVLGTLCVSIVMD